MKCGITTNIIHFSKVIVICCSFGLPLTGIAKDMVGGRSDMITFVLLLANPSSTMSSVPSQSSTKRPWYADYIVSSLDSRGDGWNGNLLFLSPDSFTVSSEYSGTSTTCLTAGIYSPYAYGGSCDYEVSWSDGGLSGSTDATCTQASGSFRVSAPMPTPALTQMKIPSPVSSFMPSPLPTVSSLSTLAQSRF